MATKPTFSNEWNTFQSWCYRVTQNHFEEIDEESDPFEEELKSFETNEERVRHVLQHKTLRAALEEQVDRLFFSSDTDSSDVQIFTPNESLTTIDSLSKSISVLLSKDSKSAEKNIVDLAKKRVMEFFHFQRYVDCMDEIVEFNLHGNEIESIEAQCKQILLDNNEDVLNTNYIQIGTENNKLSGAAKCVEMSTDLIKGRILRSNACVEKNTVMIVEDAYIHWLRPSLYHRYCYGCLKELTMRYLYCGKCLKVRFCSLKCLKNSTARFHAGECDYMNVLKPISMGHMALRMVFVAGVDVVVATALKAQDEINCDKFQNNYESIYTLIGDNHMKDSTLFISHCIGGAVLALYAAKMSIISKESEHFSLFAGIMFKHLMQVMLNTFVMYDCNLTNQDFTDLDVNTFILRKRKKVGTGLYATSSLLSHSCANNCLKYSHNSKLIVIAQRDISKNEEITINYGTTVTITPDVHARNVLLYSNFGFYCTCSACS